MILSADPGRGSANSPGLWDSTTTPGTLATWKRNRYPPPERQPRASRTSRAASRETARATWSRSSAPSRTHRKPCGRRAQHHMDSPAGSSHSKASSHAAEGTG
ncbi:hypothetical protein ACFPRL_33190 [Pseudoclavibacter helvolus]